MNKAQIIFGILLLFQCLLSCDGRVTANFTISNKTDVPIDSMRIEPNVISEGQYLSLAPQESADYRADMTTIPKSDGSYLITYRINNESKNQRFCYYTNGQPLEKLIKIDIKKDTVLIDSQLE